MKSSKKNRSCATDLSRLGGSNYEGIKFGVPEQKPEASIKPGRKMAKSTIYQYAQYADSPIKLQSLNRITVIGNKKIKQQTFPQKLHFFPPLQISDKIWQNSFPSPKQGLHMEKIWC